MAIMSKSRNRSVIVATIILAMILTILPLPDSIRLFRPEWVLMTLIYWAMALPNRVSIGVAWVTGLLMDVMLGSAFGVMAFSYAFAIFLIARFHLQLRQYPLWQQAITILSVVFMSHLLSVIFSPVAVDWRVCLPALTSTLLWPPMYALLRSVRRTFSVS